MGNSRRNPRITARRNRSRNEKLTEKLKGKLQNVKLDIELASDKKKKEARKENKKKVKSVETEYDKDAKITMIIKNSDVFDNAKAKPKKVYNDSEEKIVDSKVNEVKERVNIGYVAPEIQKKQPINISNKMIIITSLIVLAICVVSITIIYLNMNNKNIKKSNKNNTVNTPVEAAAKVKDNNAMQEEFMNKIIQNREDSKQGMKLTFLGDVMMGGEAFKKITESYSIAFKDIAYTTSVADFTIANFTTVIDEKKPEDAYNNYITSSSSISALKALGVNVVNLANDHILDYGDYLLKNTISVLNKNNFITVGVNDAICYLEKNGIKVAIVAANDVVIGTRSSYENAGVAMYSKENVEKNIKMAKENADIVIASFHYGMESKHEITNKMSDMAKHAIDSGADMVVGHHAMGVLPVEIYNGKPILYSIGHLISDTKSEYVKQSATFDIEISSDSKVSKIVMNPVYIAEKETVKCEGYKLTEFLIDLEKGCKGLGTPVEIIDSKIVINLKK